VVVDVEDSSPKTVATGNIDAELGARDVEVAGEDLAVRVAGVEVAQVAGAEDREEVDREEQSGRAEHALGNGCRVSIGR
jgi:hypothetical protein